MSATSRGSPTRTLPVRAWVPAFLAALVVALVLLGSSPSGHGRLPSAGAWSGGSTWGNGLATAVFEPTQPGVTVSAVQGESGYGLYAGLGGLGEYTTGGTLVASADFADAHWQVTDRSTPALLEHDYAATVGVGAHGSVAIEVNFTMAAAGGPAGVSSTAVTYTIAEQGWPWVSNADELGTLQPLWPNNTSLEHIDLTAQGTRMDCLSNETGTAQEYFDWGGSMVARGPSGALAALEPSLELSGNSQYVPLVVLLTGAPGGYSQFSYDPAVGILTPAAPAGLPLSDLLIGLGAAGAGVFLAALLLARVQRRPPSLELAGGP
jgi:hypothetical protein